MYRTQKNETFLGNYRQTEGLSEEGLGGHSSCPLGLQLSKWHLTRWSHWGGSPCFSATELRAEGVPGRCCGNDLLEFWGCRGAEGAVRCASSSTRSSVLTCRRAVRIELSSNVTGRRTFRAPSVTGELTPLPRWAPRSLRRGPLYGHNSACGSKHPRACVTLGATGATRHFLRFLLLSHELKCLSLGLFSYWKGNISECGFSFSGFTLLFELGKTTVPHRWLLEPINDCMQEWSVLLIRRHRDPFCPLL